MKSLSSEYIKSRDKSLISACELERLYVLKNFPIHMLSQGEEDYCHDLIFSIGIDDGFVQLADTIEGSALYVDTHSNAIGRTWQLSREFMADAIAKVVKESSNILEIGGGTGKLSVECDIKGIKYSKWTIIEPQPCPVEECKAEYIQGFFPSDAVNKKYDVVMHSHVLEHAEDLHVFFAAVKKVISDRGKMIFMLPDMQRLLERNVTSIINFEHTFYLTQEYVEYLLKCNGFVLTSVDRFGDGHSILFVADYIGEEFDKPELKSCYEKNKLQWLNYFKNQEDMVRRWNREASKFAGKVYLFGAHISSQYYVSYGLDVDRIEAILDNDTYKVGKHVAGIDKTIIAPKSLTVEDEILVIIPPNPYSAEIIDGLAKHSEKIKFLQ